MIVIGQDGTKWFILASKEEFNRLCCLIVLDALL